MVNTEHGGPYDTARGPAAHDRLCLTQAPQRFAAPRALPRFDLDRVAPGHRWVTLSSSFQDAETGLQGSCIAWLRLTQQGNLRIQSCRSSGGHTEEAAPASSPRVPDRSHGAHRTAAFTPPRVPAAQDAAGLRLV